MDSTRVAQLQQQYGIVEVAVLDRSDSEMFREDRRENEAFVAALGRLCVLRRTYDAAYGPDTHVRVYDVSNCRARKA